MLIPLKRSVTSMLLGALVLVGSGSSLGGCFVGRAGSPREHRTIVGTRSNTSVSDVGTRGMLSDPLQVVGKDMSPQQAEAVLDEVGDSILYGPMLGETAVNIGTAVAFPPFALYLIGNAILSVSGYEAVGVSSLLPDEQAEAWTEAVDDVFSGPGRVVAAVAGRESRSRAVTEHRLNQILSKKPVKLDDSSGNVATDESIQLQGSGSLSNSVVVDDAKNDWSSNPPG